MNKDPLEDFIQSNRQAFEEPFDSDKGWQKLPQPKTPKRETNNNGLSWLKIAAIFVMAAGLIGLSRYYDGTPGPQVVEVIVKMEDLSPELAEVKHHYTSTIGKKMEEATEKWGENVGARFASELAFIDEQQDMLSAEMQQNVNNSKIVEAMIKNYKIKLRLLEDMLEDIENEKKRKNDNSRNTIEL